MATRREQRQPRRRFTAEFKREAVALSERQQQEGRSLADIARDLGVHPQTLRYWQETGAGAIGRETRGTPRDLRALELEVKRLQREVARVEEERDFLKRAAAFFAKESP
jgi:transposase